MKDVVIVEAVRTPVGNHGGVFRDVDAKELARTVIRGVLDRTGLDPAALDEVIFGCIAQPSDAPNITRVAALMAGVPKEVPGYTVARNCNSGMDAIVQAYRSIQVGDGEIYLVGGVESMSNIPYIVKGRALGLEDPARAVYRCDVGGADRPHLRAVDGAHRREPGRRI